MSWLVLGAGISGLGAATLLKSKNYRVHLADVNPDKISHLTLKPFDLLFSDSDLSAFEQVSDGFILSPGIPLNHPFVAEAYRRKLNILSEIDLGLSYFEGKLIAVTGTNGKSTTATMIYHLLSKAGFEVSLAGNIGVSLCATLAEKKIEPILVLEVSSYQLEHSEKIKADIGMITNISWDHLARHHTMENYVRCKWRIAELLKPTGFLLFDDSMQNSLKEYGIPYSHFHPKILMEDGVSLQVRDFCPLKEKHNLLNAQFAIDACTSLTGKCPEFFLPHLSSFEGLPHRFATIGHLFKKAVINDSKSTNVASTMRALENFEEKVILFIGGVGKEESFLPLLKYKNKIHTVVAFGKEQEKIYAELHSFFPTFAYKSLADALLNFPHILKSASPLPILFSPACASFDEFKNFEDRGQFFLSKMASYLDNSSH